MQQVHNKEKKGNGVFSINSGMNSYFWLILVEGNYTICVDNLSRTQKTFTLHYEVILESSIDFTGSQSRTLKKKINEVQSSLGRILSNIDKLGTRESVQGESKAELND